MSCDMQGLIPSASLAVARKRLMAVTHVSSGLRCLNGPATKAVNRKGGAFDKTSRILCMFSHVTVPEESVLELFQAKIFSRLCVPEEITLAWWLVNTP